MATEMEAVVFISQDRKPGNHSTDSLDITLKDPYYGRLSPVYKADIHLWGLTFPSAAHLYYAQKYLYEGAPAQNKAMVRAILSLPRPIDAGQLSYKRKTYYSSWQIKVNALIEKHLEALPRCDWADIRIAANVLALRAKFSQDEEAARLLRSTEIRQAEDFCNSSRRLILKGFPACSLAMEQVRREMLEGNPEWAFIPASPFPLQKIMRRR